MARIRTIKPEFPQSESMGRISRDARLLFVQMWTISDDSGRLRGNSRMLASLLFPYDDDAPALVPTWLDELTRENCIQRYETEGQSYIQILNWLNHQKIDKPSPSKIPEFVDSSRILANPRRRKGSRTKDQGEDQGEEGSGPISPEPQSDSALVASPPALVRIPLTDSSEFDITQAHVDEWLDAYPAVDAIAQCREMRAWSLANPTLRKTRSGVLRFCNTWLSKRQNQAQSGPPFQGKQAGLESRNRAAGADFLKMVESA